VNAEEVKARGHNLDIKNPHAVADDHGDPETLLRDLARAEAETATYRDQLKAISHRGARPMNAERLLAHYEKIADAPDAIARLRRFILDLAVRGKLVPQAANDEPASELLKQIAKEKARLVKGGEIRTPKASDPIRDDELPIRSPQNWAWARLCDIGKLSGGMTPSMNRYDFWDGDIVWLSPKDIKSDEVTDSELRISAIGLAETRLELYRPGCIFMVARSGILKRTFPFRSIGFPLQQIKT
jgi:hypothetical protein